LLCLPPLVPPRPRGPLALTHLDGSESLSDQVLSENRGDFVSCPGVVVAQGHPVDDTCRVADDPHFHTVLR